MFLGCSSLHSWLPSSPALHDPITGGPWGGISGIYCVVWLHNQVFFLRIDLLKLQPKYLDDTEVTFHWVIMGRFSLLQIDQGVIAKGSIWHSHTSQSIVRTHNIRLTSVLNHNSLAWKKISMQISLQWICIKDSEECKLMGISANHIK